MALAAYRNLLRATRIAFRGSRVLPLKSYCFPDLLIRHAPTGDAPVMAAAHEQIRHKFRQDASLDSSSADAQGAIQHAQQVAKFLRENIVQGRKAEGRDDTYSQYPRYAPSAPISQATEKPEG